MLNTRSFHSADCNTDLALVGSKKLLPKKIHHSKRKCRPCINAAYASVPSFTERYLNSLEQALHSTPGGGVATTWSHVRDSIYNAAMTTFGKQRKSSIYWFETRLSVMEPVIEAKHSALLNYQKNPNVSALSALRTARSTAQRTARKCANDYWQNLCGCIQMSSDTGDIRGMYEDINIAFGPTTKKTAPLKSKTGETITDPNKQMERWVEHYLELSPRENVFTETAINAAEPLPAMRELDELPSEKEFSDVIDRLTNGTAPGSNFPRNHQVCQTCAAHQTSPPVLGGGHNVSSHAGCHNHNPVQE